MEINLEHGRYAISPEQLDSGAGRALLRFRDELVLQLFFRHGAFWDAVRDVRTGWGIEAEIALPPNLPHLFIPEDASKPESHQALRKWEDELGSVVHKVLPQRFRNSDLDADWKRFVSACVLYDPPETDLLAYADLSGPSPYGFAARTANNPGTDPQKPLRVMQAPPIRRLRDAAEAQRAERWYWRQIIDEIGKRHLRPLGLDIWSLLDDVVNNSPDITEEYRNRHDRNRPRSYILVEEHTTTREVERAMSILAAAREGEPKGGAPSRAPLVAIQCALLYDRHNGKDPHDGRRKKWTYGKLGKRFGLASARAAEEHVREGRKLLQAKPQLEE